MRHKKIKNFFEKHTQKLIVMKNVRFTPFYPISVFQIFIEMLKWKVTHKNSSVPEWARTTTAQHNISAQRSQHTTATIFVLLTSWHRCININSHDAVFLIEHWLAREEEHVMSQSLAHEYDHSRIFPERLFASWEPKRTTVRRLAWLINQKYTIKGYVRMSEQTSKITISPRADANTEIVLIGVWLKYDYITSQSQDCYEHNLLIMHHQTPTTCHYGRLEWTFVTTGALIDSSDSS